MNLFQVMADDCVEALFNVTDENLSDEQVESLIKEASNFDDEEEGEEFLSKKGIERVFVTEIYI